MMYLILDAVVNRVVPGKTQPDAKGVVRHFFRAHVQTDLGVKVLEIMDGVDVPVNWQVRIWCTGIPDTYSKTSWGETKTFSGALPDKIVKCVPVKERRIDVDAWMLGKSEDSASPAGSTASGLPRMNSK